MRCCEAARMNATIRHQLLLHGHRSCYKKCWDEPLRCCEPVLLGHGRAGNRCCKDTAVLRRGHHATRAPPCYEGGSMLCCKECRKTVSCERHHAASRCYGGHFHAAGMTLVWRGDVARGVAALRVASPCREACYKLVLRAMLREHRWCCKPHCKWRPQVLQWGVASKRVVGCIRN